MGWRQGSVCGGDWRRTPPEVEALQAAVRRQTMGSQRVGAGVIFDPFDESLAGLAFALQGGLGDAGGFRGLRQIVGGAPGLGGDAGFDDLLRPVPGAVGDAPVGAHQDQPEDGQRPGVTEETAHQTSTESAATAPR